MIVHLSSCRDICSATMVCKDLFYLGNAISMIEVSSTPSMGSVQRFLTRRVPLGLKVSNLLFTRPHKPLTAKLYAA